MRIETRDQGNDGRWHLLAAAILAVLLLFSSAISIAAQQGAPQGGTTTVYLVRHAEKELVPGDDPGLTEDGERRALDLLHVLEEAGVTAVYATQYRRTQSTVRPLADFLGIDIGIVNAGDSQRLARTIRERHSGEVVVVCGHSNTVPEIVEALGAGRVEPIVEADEYDNLYVVRIAQDGSADVTTLKYGSRPQ